MAPDLCLLVANTAGNCTGQPQGMGCSREMWGALCAKSARGIALIAEK